MRALSLMLKPASSECNLACGYCFYHSLCASRSAPSHGFMSERTFERILSKAVRFASGAPIALSFQGGEPLLRGKEFFLRAASAISGYRKKGIEISVGIQTNGTLIDEEWCDIFAKNGWLVGLSLDGDEEANAFRVDKNGNATFSKVIAAARLMQRKNVEFNVLSVLTAPVAQDQKQARASTPCNLWPFTMRKGTFRRAKDVLSRGKRAHIAERPGTGRSGRCRATCVKKHLT